MNMPTEVWIAIIGLGGAFVGTGIQAFVSRTGARVARQTAFESGLALRRMEVYVRLVRHLAQCEAMLGRNIGAFGDRITGDGILDETRLMSSDLALEAGGEFEAELITLSSQVVATQFAHWRVLWVENLHAYLLLRQAQTLGMMSGIEHPSDEEISDMEALLQVTAVRSSEIVRRMLGTIHAEIQGARPWYARVDLRQRLRNRRRYKELDRREWYVETETARLRDRVLVLERQVGESTDDPMTARTQADA